MLLHDRQLPLALSEYEVSFARLDAARADPTSPLQLSAGLKWEHSMRNVENCRQIQYDRGTNCDISTRKKRAQSQNKNLLGLL